MRYLPSAFLFLDAEAVCRERRGFVSALQSSQPVWSYVSRVFFAVPLLGTFLTFIRIEYSLIIFAGSFHLSDILAVWGYLPTDPSTEMQSRWISFATTLNPNVRGYTNWPNCAISLPSVIASEADFGFADGSDATLLQFTELGSGRIPDTFRKAAIGCECFFATASASISLTVRASQDWNEISTSLAL